MVLLYVLPDYINDPRLTALLNMSFGILAVFAAATSSGNLRRFLASRTVGGPTDHGQLTRDRLSEEEVSHWHKGELLHAGSPVPAGFARD